MNVIVLATKTYGKLALVNLMLQRFTEFTRSIDVEMECRRQVTKRFQQEGIILCCLKISNRYQAKYTIDIHSFIGRLIKYIFYEIRQHPACTAKMHDTVMHFKYLLAHGYNFMTLAIRQLVEESDPATPVV